MPSSVMGSCRIITILSLVALSILSFTVLFGVDTLTQDTSTHHSPFSPPKSNLVHHRRALHHARASTPAAASESNAPQADPTPSTQSAPSPAANTQSSTPTVASPSPSSQPAQSSSSARSSSPAASTSPATSAAPSSSSSPSPSSPSPSSSLSSDALASSSRGVTSSSVGAVSSIANSPTTTFVKTPNSYTSGFAPTTTGSTLTIAAAATGSDSSSGFFKNKAAVGATFGIIGVVGGLAIIMGVLTILRRHRRTREAIENEEFFEKYHGGDFGGEPVPHTSRGFGTGSLSPSEVDISTSAAPPDAYPDRAVHYGQSNSGTVLNPVDYGIAYPPGAADDNSTPATGSGNVNVFEDVELSHSASHPFADPANTSFANAAPPVTYSRPTPGRAQEMVAIDSYYGLNSAGVGAGGMGYAQ